MTTVEPLSALLSLAPAGTDAFTGITHGPDAGVERIFGGHIAAQALLAAAATVEPGRDVHSLHCAFVRAGRPGLPVRYDVVRYRDGRAFSTRRVTGSQGPNVIFESFVSFHGPEGGADWTATPMPDVPAAEDCPFVETVITTLPTLSVYEQRLLRPLDPGQPLTMVHPVWVRPVGDLPGSPHVGRAIIATLSDLGAVRATMGPEFAVADGGFTGASLDHAVWFHREPPTTDGWVLVDMDPLSNHAGRGLAVGRAWAADGTHVATWMQEALLRVH